MDRAFGSPAEDRPPLKPRVTPRNRLRLPVPIVKLTRYGLWVMWSATTIHQAAADAVNKAHKDWGNGSGEHAPPRVWREDARNNAGAFPKLEKRQ